MLLLLSVSLIPAMIISLSYVRSLSKARDELSSSTREALISRATYLLQVTVENFGLATKREATIFELALKRQAIEVEARLADAPPETYRLFMSEDYAIPARAPGDLKNTERYTRRMNGRDEPIPVSFEEQTFFVVNGVRRTTVEDDMRRLTTMPTVYRELLAIDPAATEWLYTSLACGFHSCYPGHGGYPEEYDPRVRAWYMRAEEADNVVWTLLPGVSTRRVALTASMPVKYADGTFAGVTAIDVSLAEVHRDVVLPEHWRRSATVLHVTPNLPGYEGQLAILLCRDYAEQGEQWRQTVSYTHLRAHET